VNIQFQVVRTDGLKLVRLNSVVFQGGSISAGSGNLCNALCFMFRFNKRVSVLEDKRELQGFLMP
jgi:hypothetical protein